jgi:hypothetical protein
MKYTTLYSVIFLSLVSFLFAEDKKVIILIPDYPSPTMIHGLPEGWKHGINKQDRLIVFWPGDQTWEKTLIRWQIQSYGNSQNMSVEEYINSHIQTCNETPKECKTSSAKKCNIKLAKESQIDCQSIEQEFKDETGTFYLQRIVLLYKSLSGKSYFYESKLFSSSRDLYEKNRILHYRMTEETLEPKYVEKVITE